MSKKKSTTKKNKNQEKKFELPSGVTMETIAEAAEDMQKELLLDESLDTEESTVEEAVDYLKQAAELADPEEDQFQDSTLIVLQALDVLPAGYSVEAEEDSEEETEENVEEAEEVEDEPPKKSISKKSTKKKTESESTGKKSTSKKNSAGKKATSKSSAKKSPSKNGDKKPGVIATLVEFCRKSKKSFTKEDVLEHLKSTFPERNEQSMWGTVKAQIPNRINKERDFELVKTKEGKYRKK